MIDGLRRPGHAHGGVRELKRFKETGDSIMTKFMLTTYVLIWPLVAAAVLALLCFAVWRDLRTASQNGEDFV
jgi:hypothetical protein